MTSTIRYIGREALDITRTLGHSFLFLFEALSFVFIPPFRHLILLRQIRFIGTKSMIVIILIGTFTGMVLALQVFHTLRQVGSEAFLGPAVAISLIRELGPVISALTVTGRAGSAMTAEVGIMRITDQIDALISMALNPIRYLITPNILASFIALPLLTALFDFVGIFGGYFVGVKMLGLSSGTYFSLMEHFIDMGDIMTGFYKSLCFGVIISWVCCYKGFFTGYGAEGVSKATTEAVVTSSVLILISDYVLGSLLL